MGLRDTFGTFEQQGLSNTKIPNSLLFGNHVKFNASIIRRGGKVLLSYRCYHPQHGRTSIAISELDKNWMPTGAHTAVKIPCPKNKERHEDQRFFEHKGCLWMSCSEIYESGNGWGCSQKLYRLDDNFQPDHTLDIAVGRNFHGTEKNWMFFSHQNRLFFIYDVHKQHAFEVDDQSGAVLNEFSGSRFHWPFGHLRGGNSPEYMEIGGKKGYLTFLHSATAHIWAKRRYSMSAAILAPEPPFNVQWLSENPICYGTREEEFCGSGNGQCVFPCGALLDKDQWHVAAGVNDTFNTIFHLDPAQVLAGLVPAEHFLVSRQRHYLSRSPRMVGFIAEPAWPWTQIYNGQYGSVGLCATDDPFAQEQLDNDKDCSRIPASEFNELLPKPKQNQHRPTNEQVKKHYELPVQTRKKNGLLIQRGIQRPSMQPVRLDGRIVYN